MTMTFLRHDVPETFYAERRLFNPDDNTHKEEMIRLIEARRQIDGRIKELQDIEVLSNTFYPERRLFNPDDVLGK